jgi:hypothetical protein
MADYYFDSEKCVYCWKNLLTKTVTCEGCWAINAKKNKYRTKTTCFLCYRCHVESVLTEAKARDGWYCSECLKETGW